MIEIILFYMHPRRNFRFKKEKTIKVLLVRHRKRGAQHKSIFGLNEETVLLFKGIFSLAMWVHRSLCILTLVGLEHYYGFLSLSFSLSSQKIEHVKCVQFEVESLWLALLDRKSERLFFSSLSSFSCSCPVSAAADDIVIVVDSFFAIICVVNLFAFYVQQRKRK